MDNTKNPQNNHSETFCDESVQKALLSFVSFIEHSEPFERMNLLLSNYGDARSKLYNPSTLQRNFYTRKILLIDAMLNCYNTRQNDEIVKALYEFNSALSEIVGPTEILRRFDGTTAECANEEEARTLAEPKDREKAYKSAQDTLDQMTPAEIRGFVEKFSTNNCLDENKLRLDLSNTILNGTLSVEGSKKLRELLNVLSQSDHVPSLSTLSVARETTLDCLRAQYGSIDSLTKLYRSLYSYEDLRTHKIIKYAEEVEEPSEFDE